MQKLLKFAKIIEVCKNYWSLQKLLKFAKIIQVCKNYWSLQKLFKFAKIIEVCKNYSSLQKLFKFAKIIQVCKNYSSLLDPDGTPYKAKTKQNKTNKKQTETINTLAVRNYCWGGLMKIRGPWKFDQNESNRFSAIYHRKSVNLVYFTYYKSDFSTIFFNHEISSQR